MAERAPTITVVVAHYGDPAPTSALLADLAGQTARAEAEVIVVDDASPQPFGSSPGVRVIRRPTNGGFGSAVNTGARAGTGRWLLVLNSDLRLGPDVLAGLLAAGQRWYPAVLGPRVIGPDGLVDHTARRFPTITAQTVEWLVPLARWRDTPLLHTAVGHDLIAHRATAASTTDWLVGAALMLPLDQFRAVGGFDEAFYMNSEEVDLQRRLRGRGLPSIYLPTVTVTHLGGASSDPALRRRWLVASRVQYARTWGSGHNRLRGALSAASVANLVWNLGRAAAGRRSRPWHTVREEFDTIWRS